MRQPFRRNGNIGFNTFATQHIGVEKRQRHDADEKPCAEGKTSIDRDGAFGVINVDFMLSVMPGAGDEVYVGDDGVLSSPGGTFWNPSDPFTSITDAHDEFDEATPIDLVVTNLGLIFIGAATNELQDNGITDVTDDPTKGFFDQDR